MHMRTLQGEFDGRLQHHVEDGRHISLHSVAVAVVLV